MARKTVAVSGYKREKAVGKKSVLVTAVDSYKRSKPKKKK